jgi:hypothetical protein
MGAPTIPGGFQTLSSSGQLNGVTEVTVVGAPASGKTRVVRTVTVCNNDTASITPVLQLRDGGNVYHLGARTLFPSAVAGAPGDDWIYDGLVALDTPSKSLTAVLAAAPASNQPDYTAIFAEES